MHRRFGRSLRLVRPHVDHFCFGSAEAVAKVTKSTTHKTVVFLIFIELKICEIVIELIEYTYVAALIDVQQFAYDLKLKVNFEHYIADRKATTCI